MSVRVTTDGVIELSGRCGVEDAEVLQRRLLAAPPGTPVQWHDCEFLHSAVVQVLLAGQVPMRGAPQNAFLETHLAPVIVEKEQG